MFAKISLVVLSLLFHSSSAVESAAELLDWIALSASEEDPRAAVQVDLLPDYEGAEALASELRDELADGAHALEVFVEIVPGDAELPPSYRVGVGPFSDFEDAERAKLALEGVGIDGFVRELDDTLGC